MKDQYFGDVNDYRKYGLLRKLTGYGSLSLGVCWMLTSPDSSGQGDVRSYLKNHNKHRSLDPELFDWLDEGKDESRCVGRIEQTNLLGKATVFASSSLSDDKASRAEYFREWNRHSGGCDLVFFDPDNGIEVASKKVVGSKNSSKYLYYDELKLAYEKGASVLLYQHFIRENRDKFISRIIGELRSRISPAQIFSFRTPHVLFLLLAQDRHISHFSRVIEENEKNWGYHSIHPIK